MIIDPLDAIDEQEPCGTTIQQEIRNDNGATIDEGDDNGDALSGGKLIFPGLQHLSLSMYAKLYMYNPR